ncbi:MAG TPA: hypothetical protein VJ957_04110 [Longimicrobiales bacterium]|nr:hypothetical protein [Longimicrobiales bacterium]
MNTKHAHRRWLVAAVLGLTVTATAGCDVHKLLQVDPVDRVPAEGLTTPANAELLVNGAIADFSCAYGAYVALSGVVAGELTDATQTAARWPADRRDFSQESYQAQYATYGCTGLGVYIPLSTARWSAENILNALQGWTDADLSDYGFDRQDLIAQAALYAGYTYVVMGEGFCSMAIDLSAEMTPAQVLALAVERFTTAITAAQSAGNTPVLNAARVGLARASLDLGQAANALAAAQQVPAGFDFEIETSGDFSVRNNRVFAQNGEPPLGGTALSVGEAYWHYLHYGEADPRVAVSDSIRINSDGTPLYYQHKYMALDDPLRLASYDEAQLIIAEIQGGTTAEGIIDAFHTAAGLSAVDWTGATAQDILDHVVEERRAVLWLEGRRLYDINRFNLTMEPAAGTPYRKGLTYSDYRCFPLPDVEIRNNPNIS